MDQPSDQCASFREVMASYPTGVTIVASCQDDGTPYGLTVNSFSSVSLEPPLVLICIGHTSTSHDRLVAASGFTINVLAASQAEAAGRFARDPSEGRFDEVAWQPGPSGNPVLEGSVAFLDCSIHEVLTGGDHSIVVGRVDHCTLHDRPALLFHRGRLSSVDE